MKCWILPYVASHCHSSNRIPGANSSPYCLCSPGFSHAFCTNFHVVQKGTNVIAALCTGGFNPESTVFSNYCNKLSKLKLNLQYASVSVWMVVKEQAGFSFRYTALVERLLTAGKQNAGELHRAEREKSKQKKVIIGVCICVFVGLVAARMCEREKM